MAKAIAIIGGGISGLALLHYLTGRFGDGAAVTLYERNADVGGNIASRREQGFLFEGGPNGFLYSEPTMALIDALGLTDQLVAATPKVPRYVCQGGRLMPVPMSPGSFVQTPLLSLADKMRLVQGLFMKDVSKDQSIYDYAVARFGRNAALRLFDPFVSGIYAGDIKRLHMGESLAKMSRPKKGRGLFSLKEGMGQLTASLAAKYRARIRCGSPVTSFEALKADHVFCTVPAYAASPLVARLRPALAQALDHIVYAPVAAVGLGFPKDAFKTLPDGFGYVVPSGEGRQVLGVLIESNVYAGRAPEGMLMLRVLMGGRHHPDVAAEDGAALIKRALGEINDVYGLKGVPVMQHVKVWSRAIPQYEMNYPQLLGTIRGELRSLPNLTLSGNYLDGVGVNDCIAGAHAIANAVPLSL